MAYDESIKDKAVHGIDILLTDEQRAQIENFWKETGSVGKIDLKIDVTGDKISPAAIQVGTAK